MGWVAMGDGVGIWGRGIVMAIGGVVMGRSTVTG